jgi:two-component system, chemotaxis family, protein-glutamate methylesterase/glutaminase
MARPFRILVCDDQATIRQLLILLMGTIPDTEVLAGVGDAETAWAVLARQPVDLVLLDLELPGRHGFALLERIMRECPVPVIIISGADGAAGPLRDQAMALGAIGFIAKPDGVTTTHETLQRSLSLHVAQLRKAPEMRQTGGISEPALAGVGLPVVAIGSSTGGIIAVIEVLKRLPPHRAPTLITQHMLPGYAEGFAARLSGTTGRRVAVAQGGEVLGGSTVLVAPSGRHLMVRRQGNQLVSQIDGSEKVSGHRPSCDKLFHSVAEAVGAHAIGVLLTGMGRDGAEGLLAMRRAGARTLAQDEASSVVFGMPKAALDLGAAERAVPLNQIGGEIASLLAAAASERRPSRKQLQTENLP